MLRYILIAISGMIFGAMFRVGIKRKPLLLILSLACIVAAALIPKSAHALQVTVSVAVDDSSFNEPYVRQLVRDASDIAGVDFQVIEYAVADPAPGVSDSDDILEAMQVARKSQSGDVSLLISSRALTVEGGEALPGARVYAGYAMIDSACSQYAVAVSWPTVEMIAHELLHTIGVTHDEDPSAYLMSPYSESTVRSEQTVNQITEFPGCKVMAQAAPRAEPASSGGGGGAFDPRLGLALLSLFFLRDGSRKP